MVINHLRVKPDLPTEALRAAHPFAALGFSRADTMAAGPGAGKTAAEVVWGTKNVPLELWISVVFWEWIRK